jgi:cobalt-zinc-cadmium efflux system membrane fusion protein
MKKLISCGIAAALSLILVSCSKRDSGDAHKHDHDHKPAHKHEPHNHGTDEKDHDHDHEEDRKSKKDQTQKQEGKSEETILSLTPEQREMIQLKVSNAAPGQQENLLRLDGEIRYNLEKTAKVMPRLPGFVSRVDAVEGQTVRKGEILAVLQSQKLGELYSDYHANKELEALNLSEFRIAEKLRAKDAMSEIDYLKAKRQYADTQIARRRAEAILTALNLNPAHLPHGCRLGQKSEAPVCTEYEMKSPLDGIVVVRDITPGETYAEDNTKPSFIVADTRELWLELRARQEDLPQLRVGQEVKANLGRGFAEYNGKIAFISPEVNEATRTALVRVLLDNTDGKLKPGLFAVGMVRLESSSHSLLVPRAAVQEVGGESVVFVPHDGGFVAVPVKIGRFDRDFGEIVSGLKEGDEYVSNGAFELKSMIVTAGMDPHAGHGH